MQNQDLNIVIVGHVDHGKSTIIGKLLVDTNSLPEGKLEQVKQNCKKNAKPFEYAFLLDALKEEQAQGITIDIARCYFKSSLRSYNIIDAPGHTQFLKNMITGSARAEIGILVVDAKEGIKENTFRHAYMMSLLEIKEIIVLVNKMDLVDYEIAIYKRIVKELKSFLNKIDLKVKRYIPASGFEGDNIALKTSNMKWYKGKTLLEALDYITIEQDLENKPFRMFVQDVYKFTNNKDDRRIIAGKVLSGELEVGDEVIFYPSRAKSQVKSLEEFNNKITRVKAGYSAGIIIKDEQYIKRGELMCIANEKQPQSTLRILVNLFWLSDSPMELRKTYCLKIGSSRAEFQIEEIISVINSSTLKPTGKNIINKNEVCECIIRLNKYIYFDFIDENIHTNRFVISHEYTIVGGGIIKSGLENFKTNEELKNNIVMSQGKIDYARRCSYLNQRGMVLWFTGISGAGKTTLAIELENALFESNKYAVRLDGDDLRHGINSDLGFTSKDRVENLRRIAQLACFLKNQGIICIVSSISPFEHMREYASNLIGRENFIEIYLKIDLNECIKRDVKGLYKKANNNEIHNFTGITQDYEEPVCPDIIINTGEVDIESAKEIIFKYLIERLKNKDY